MVAHNRELAKSCLQETGPLFLHADTVSVARDHEALRIALGERQVSWLVLSYGTQLAANYADLYPNRTRAMVLDAALEHSGSEVQLTADAISTVEQAFNRFVEWCATAADCVLQGQDVAAVYDQLVKSADQNPIPVEGALRPVTGDDIRMNTPLWLLAKTPNVLAGELSWPVFSEVIRRAVAGDAVFFAFPPPQGPTDGYFAQLANHCGDYVADIHTFADMQQRIEMGRQLAPHLQGGVGILARRLVHRLSIQGRQSAAHPGCEGRAHTDRPFDARPVRLVQVGLQPGSPDPRQQRAVPCR